MDRIYIDNNSKLHKIMALSGAISPINESPVRFYCHPRKSPSFDSRANYDVLSSFENLDSPIAGYCRSRSPLSAIENLEISQPLKSPTVFKTPVNVEEDVIVMDGILVGPVTGGRVRSSSSTSDSVRRVRSSLSTLDSSGSLSSGGKSFSKKEICRSWEDSGSCRYGAKCQFAHGKEELRPTRFLNKNKVEMCKSYSSGSCSYGSKCRYVHHQHNSSASATDSPLSVTSSTPRTFTPIKLEKAMNYSESSSSTTQTVSPVKQQNAMDNSKSSSIAFASTDWSPLDDGIEVALPYSTSPDKALSRKEVDAHINSVLYGPNRKKTLPVFAEICPR